MAVRLTSRLSRMLVLNTFLRILIFVKLKTALALLECLSDFRIAGPGLKWPRQVERELFKPEGPGGGIALELSHKSAVEQFQRICEKASL